MIAPGTSVGEQTTVHVARYLVTNGWLATGRSRTKVYRLAARSTLLIDKPAELARPEIRDTLATGYARGNALGHTREYDTFGPKMFVALAGMKPPLDPEIISRSIQVPVRALSNVA